MLRYYTYSTVVVLLYFVYGIYIMRSYKSFSVPISFSKQERVKTILLFVILVFVPIARVILVWSIYKTNQYNKYIYRLKQQGIMKY